MDVSKVQNIRGATYAQNTPLAPIISSSTWAAEMCAYDFGYAPPHSPIDLSTIILHIDGSLKRGTLGNPAHIGFQMSHVVTYTAKTV